MFCYYGIHRKLTTYCSNVETCVLHSSIIQHFAWSAWMKIGMCVIPRYIIGHLNWIGGCILGSSSAFLVEAFMVSPLLLDFTAQYTTLPHNLLSCFFLKKSLLKNLRMPIKEQIWLVLRTKQTAFGVNSFSSEDCLYSHYFEWTIDCRMRQSYQNLKTITMQAFPSNPLLPPDFMLSQVYTIIDFQNPRVLVLK